MQKSILTNGIPVFFEREENVHSFYFAIWVRTGSFFESKSEEGLSHFIEHMLFKGTKKRTALEIAETADNLGGNFNAFTSQEVTCFYIKVLSENANKAVELFSDMFANSLFADDEVKRERNVILEEMKMYEDEPQANAFSKLNEIVFAESGYASEIIGTRKSLKSFDHQSFVKYFRREYNANNILITCAGHFNKASVLKEIEKGFSKVKKLKENTFKDSFTYKKKNLSIKKDIKQAHIVLGLPTITSDDKNKYKHALYNQILGGGMSSKLFQSLREKQGLCYSVSSSLAIYKAAGLFGIYAGIAKENIEKTLKGIENELKNFVNNITEKDFERAKIGTISNIAFLLETYKARIDIVAKYFMSNGKVRPKNETEKIIETIKNIKIEDVKKVAENYSDIGKYSLVIVSNEKLKI